LTSTAMADVDEATVDAGPAKRRTSPILDLGIVDAKTVVFGRSNPSRHNTSAPDLEFWGFSP
jgi:hypothetical protein